MTRLAVSKSPRVRQLARSRPHRSLKSNPARVPTAAEFFAGIGLVRLALERQGWRVNFANDIDPDKLEMYEANFGREHFHLGDIHKLNVEDVPDCDLYTASFPCNDLSIAGAWADASSSPRRGDGM